MKTKNDKECIQITNNKDGTLKKVKRHKKMSPYSKNEEPKWILDNSASVPAHLKTRAKKEEIKNANRSLKKGVRQELKKDLRKKLDEL